jgi:hypothetical protein
MKRLLSMAVAVGPCLALLGCAGGAAEQKAAAPAKAEVRCYAGKGEVTLADGSKIPSGEKIVRRTLDPLNSRILEEVVELDPAGERPPQVWEVRLKVEHNARPVPTAKEPNLRCAYYFRAKEATDRLEGLGCLEGEAWSWKAWSATYQLPSRGKIESSLRLEADGLHELQKVWNDMDVLEAQVEALLSPVDAKVCSERLPPPGR